MNYSDLLTNYIENSGLSLGEISLRLTNKGISADRSYLSKLKNGNKPPASEELNRAIAEVTGGDPEKLIIAAYKEKAPPEVRSLFNKVEMRNERLYRSIETVLNPSFEKKTGKLKPFIANIFDEILGNIDHKDLKSISKEDLIRFIENLSAEVQLELLSSCSNALWKENVRLNKYKPITSYPVGDVVKVPIIGRVKAGLDGAAIQEHIGMETADAEDIKDGAEYRWLQVYGDSMIGEGIYEGDLALVRIQSDVESGELAVVIVNGEYGAIKRVYKKDNSIVLQSSNPAHPPRMFVGQEMNSVYIFGKVKVVKRKF